MSTKTLNEIKYGMSPKEMGTTGLVNYVRGEFWPLVVESTCFMARMHLAEEIITGRFGVKAAPIFRKAVYAGHNFKN